MGQCAGSSIKKLNSKTTDQYWKQPADTESFAGLPLPKLQFQGTLANFKIINCQYPKISIKAQIKGVDTFFLRPKQMKPNYSANWNFQHKFQFQMTEYQLRKSFISIMVHDDTEQVLGQIKVNLYFISTGPYHQNFHIRLKRGQNTRIYFDLKISQIIEIQLNSIEAEIDLVTKHPGEKFNYSIKTIVGHNTAYNLSSSSYTVRVKLDDKQNSEASDNTTRSLKRKNTIKLAEKQIPEGHNLVWTKADRLPMPSIVMKTLASELHHCYFQLLFWKIYDKNQTIGQQQMPELFGQCYVALHKIFESQPTVVKQNNVSMEKRTFSSEDKLWNNGKQIGKGFFKFQVTNDKYIKQMQVMIRTQEGIMKYNPIFFSSQKKNKSSSCQQLVELIKISEQIQQHAMKLDKIQTQGPQYPSIQARKLKVNIEKLLERILKLLQKSSQSAIKIYSYSSHEQMMRAQELFLNIGFKIMSYLQQQDVHINDLCWEILISLNQRGEFFLEQLGFDQNQKQKIKQNKSDEKLQRKIQIALTYNQFLSKLLKIAVDSLNMKGLQLQRNFAQLFCAYAYFRIPNFRSSILQAITRQNDPQLPQWRAIQYSLQDDIDYDELKQQVNTFTVLFDWTNNFHKCIEHLDKYQVDSNEIYEVLMREDWKFRMSKRGITFFQFIKCWVQYIQTVVVKPKDIQWKYFPGYNKLLKCFLAEMKKRPILQYPDILKLSLFKLIANQKLINPIVQILFNKANVYEPLTVIRAILFISEIFTVLHEKNKKIPATFNYYYFYQGIKIVLESQFSFAISKTIIMIYNHYKLFNLEFRRNISMLLLGKVFFKLFLHWSYNVRDVFYHLVMRLYHQALRMDANLVSALHLCQQQVNQQVRSRYQKLINMLEESQKQMREYKKQENIKNLEKDLHKKLKRNIDRRKRNGVQKKRLNSIDSSFIPDSPYSPISQKVDKSILLDTKFSLNGNSIQAQTVRAQSEINKPKYSYKFQNIQKQQEIKAMNKKEVGNFKHQIYDNTKGQKILMKSSINDQHGQYNESDFEIPKLEKQQLQYVEPAMWKFKEINTVFTKNFNNKNWELPKIQMEMALDSRQIRPQKIDQW